MIQQLYEHARQKKINGKKYWQYSYKFNKLIAIVFFPIFASLHRKSGINENGEIIVSLTSFPNRIEKVWITIASILNQTYKPKKVILWLAQNQFPNGENDLPQNLLKLKKRGLEIKFCEEDILSHKKYYYTLKNNPDDYFVTIDDDMLYPENCLEQLWETSRMYPDTVCCQFAHRIALDDEGNIDKYKNWEKCYENGTEPDSRILPVGCGGVLYPPHVLDTEVLNLEKIKSICPRMDDLWLKAMALKKHTKAVVCNEGSLIYYDVPGTRKNGLYHMNIKKTNSNDSAICSIMKQYPEVLEELRMRNI